ncbi:MAG: MerR family transcriptional regulator [Candidatus Sumerlaeia bacterium]|nr:MerR family transcriptional regulator [Candidatus Sumerlaeia bacterium]
MALSLEAAPAADKLFYRIQEVAQMTGVKPHVLRYWESEFRQLSPRKDMSDQRRYTRQDIQLIERIKRLLYEERYTIAGAKRALRQEAAHAAAKKAVDVENIRALRRDICALLSLLDSQPTAAA